MSQCTITVHVIGNGSPTENAEVLLGRFLEQYTNDQGNTIFFSNSQNCDVPLSIVAADYYPLEGLIEVIPFTDSTYIFELNPVSVSEHASKIEPMIRKSFNLLEINSSKKYRMSIYTIAGKIVSKKNINPGTNTIDLNSYESGIYILKFVNKKDLITKKISIE